MATTRNRRYRMKSKLGDTDEFCLGSWVGGGQQASGYLILQVESPQHRGGDMVTETRMRAEGT